MVRFTNPWSLMHEPIYHNRSIDLGRGRYTDCTCYTCDHCNIFIHQSATSTPSSMSLGQRFDCTCYTCYGCDPSFHRSLTGTSLRTSVGRQLGSIGETISPLTLFPRLNPCHGSHPESYTHSPSPYGSIDGMSPPSFREYFDLQDENPRLRERVTQLEMKNAGLHTNVTRLMVEINSLQPHIFGYGQAMAGGFIDTSPLFDKWDSCSEEVFLTTAVTLADQAGTEVGTMSRSSWSLAGEEAELGWKRGWCSGMVEGEGNLGDKVSEHGSRTGEEGDEHMRKRVKIEDVL